MLAVGREGLETALFLWAATQAAARGTGGTTSPLLGAALGLAVAIAARLPDLPRRAEDQPDPLLHLDRRLLDHRRRRRPRVRGSRSSGSAIPARLEQSGLRRLRHAIPPTSWYGTLLKGVFNFSPATTKLEAAAWLALCHPDADDLPLQGAPPHAHHVSEPSGSRGRCSFRKEMIMTRASRRRLAVRLDLRCLTVPLLAACTDNAPAGSPSAGVSANPRALSVQATDTACTLSAADRPVGQPDLLGHQRRLEGHRVLPARRGRPADRR